VVKRRISIPRRESNHRTPMVQPVAPLLVDHIIQDIYKSNLCGLLFRICVTVCG